MADPLTEAAKHEDWMQQMEAVEQQLELVNQNLAGISLVLAAIVEKLRPEAKKSTKKGN